MAPRRSKAIALFAIAMPLTACAKTVPFNGPVALGRIAHVDGPSVRPDRVVEDSRCPVDVACVWAGRLVVRVTVFGGAWSRQLDLTAGVPTPVADGSITLTEATPPRRTTDRPGRPLRYRFTFRFQGGL